MGVFDIITVIALGYGIYKGITNGFFVELTSFLSLAIGLFVATKFSNYAILWFLKRYDWETKVVEVVAFTVTFVFAIIAVSLLSRFLTKIADFAHLGWLNKILGAVFSFFKFLIILSIVYNLFAVWNSKVKWLSPESLEESITFTPIIEISHTLYPEIERWFYRAVSIIK
jgi:membrane protein required for colicin V production